MPWLVKLSSIFITLALSLAGLVYFLSEDKSSILFESLESKTNSLEPVFNKIKFESTHDSDIWLMEQSHQGVKIPQHEWDKIAIVVRKNTKVKVAEFYQLEPGPEPISMNLKPIGLRASCFMCHSNGPRAIRPNFDSDLVKVSFWDRARIQLWNLKIKTYGPMDSYAPTKSSKKFRFEHPFANKELDVKNCTKCHNAQSSFGRGVLTKQNSMVIKFMVENNLMPPPGFKISDQDRAAINEFIKL
jgi:hypothetical protein